MLDPTLKEQAEAALRHAQLVLDVTLDYVESVPGLDIAREDLQDVLFDVRQAIAADDAASVRRYVHEAISLEDEINQRASTLIPPAPAEAEAGRGRRDPG